MTEPTNIGEFIAKAKSWEALQITDAIELIKIPARNKTEMPRVGIRVTPILDEKPLYKDRAFLMYERNFLSILAAFTDARLPALMKAASEHNEAIDAQMAKAKEEKKQAKVVPDS